MATKYFMQYMQLEHYYRSESQESADKLLSLPAVGRIDCWSRRGISPSAAGCAVGTEAHQIGCNCSWTRNWGNSTPCTMRFSPPPIGNAQCGSHFQSRVESKSAGIASLIVSSLGFVRQRSITDL